jgi:prepilin-type N-terminal cleavage/methylation domain-containing protein
MSRTRHRAEQGFSLLELMVSMVVMMVVAGGVFGALNFYQKTYQRTEISADMHDNLRSAIDLIIQEVGQAGAMNLSTSMGTLTLTSAVVPGPLAQAVPLSSTIGIFQNEKLLVDAGASQELVTITSVGATTVTGVFLSPHNPGVQVNLMGVFPQGILGTSTNTKLQLFGDINGDGTLVYVEYICNYVAGGPGTLTRSVTPVGLGAVNPATVLVDNLITNPGGTPCFQYPAAPPVVAGFTFINQVGVTLTVQTATRDELTGNFLTMTKSALDVVPRNIQMGLNLANAGLPNRLQPTPGPTMP